MQNTSTAGKTQLHFGVVAVKFIGFHKTDTEESDIFIFLAFKL